MASSTEPRVFDAANRSYEQLPTSLELILVPSAERADIYVEPRLGPLRRIGSDGEDWFSGDGYLWACAFSAAFAAHLGWSPVLRALLGLKRRSERSVEKAEDGVRAQMLEHYIVSLAFLNGRGNGGWLNRNSITDDLIAEIQMATTDLEIREAPLEAWRDALFAGNAAWTALHAWNGGILRIDMRARRLNYGPLPGTPENPNSADVSKVPSGRVAIGDLTRLSTDDLPDKLRLLLVETKREVVEIFVELNNGHFLNVGSKAEEWSRFSDLEFRWHDVFHLTFLAVLGWSPVSRSLLAVPRSGGEEDARAQVLEEMIVARYSVERNKDPDSDGLLVARRACELTRGYAVESLSPHTWQKAFRAAESVKEELVRTRGGFVELDLRRGSIGFSPLA